MNTANKPVPPLTVYYDKSCPLCATEMHALRDLDRQGRIALVDCSAPDFASCDGMSRDALMTRIHARNPQGLWLVGLDAFEAVYAAAGLKRMARFWGSSRLRPLLERIYPVVARYRQPLSRLGFHHLVGRLLGR